MAGKPTTESVPPAGEPWRSVYIGAPRSLDGKRFAVIVKRDGGEDTIAPRATIAQALIIALSYRREFGAAMFYRDRGHLREYVIGRCRLDTNAFEAVLRGVVPRTASPASDHVRALEEIFRDDARVFFDGRLARARPRAPYQATGGVSRWSANTSMSAMCPATPVNGPMIALVSCLSLVGWVQNGAHGAERCVEATEVA